VEADARGELQKVDALEAVLLTVPRPSSPQFALRSYAYVLLHAAVLLPHRLMLGSAAAKRFEFHTLRAVLGIASALAELLLCRAAAHMGGRRLAYTLWAVLLLSSGMFTASTTFLPSTFTMVAFAAGTALSLDSRHKVPSIRS
jgi:alpha-1,2-mannosyltransferase